MALTYCTGDLFAAEVEAIVIPVNCRGVAGRGVALEARHRFPSWFHQYHQCCLIKTLHIGRPLLHWGMEPMVLSFPTKDDWRFPSRLPWIEKGLHALPPLLARHGVQSIALPKLGCGAGGLDWNDVRPLLEATLADLPCRVLVYGS